MESSVDESSTSPLHPASSGKGQRLGLGLGLGDVRLLQLLLAAEVRSSHPLSRGLSDFCALRIAELQHQSVEHTGKSGTAAAQPESGREGAPFSPENQTVQPYADGLLEVIPGKGIRLTVQRDDHVPAGGATSGGADMEILVGSPHLMAESSVPISPRADKLAKSLRAGGKVAVFMSVAGRLEAIIGVADCIRGGLLATTCSCNCC